MSGTYVRSALFSFLIGLLVVPAAWVTPARAQEAVDLSGWNAESYPSVSGFGAGSWTVAGDGLSVVQTVNGQPTFFYSDFDAYNLELEGVITVGSGGDDDLVGFALGYQPGDPVNLSAEYLLIDWKGGTQSFNFGDPSCTPGGVAEAGLAVSRVIGIPSADELWSHENFDSPLCSDLDSGVEELARGANLGGTGWQVGVDYTFRFEFSPTTLRVFVDDQLELDISGDFANGRFAFYNFSQANVTYRGFERAPLGPVALCQDVTVSAGSECSAEASIDDGSFDPDEGMITLSQDPPGPYPVGETLVTLTVTDEDDLSNTCTATVTVTEDVDPEITCPEDVTVEVAEGETVARDDSRLAGFMATATDNCDPDPDIDDDAPAVFGSGATLVTFTATDASGNSATCTATVTVIEVVEPSGEFAFDLHPGSCTNPLQVRKQGVIPAALLGDAGLDVKDIDVSSLLLEGVAPLRHSYEDVGTPFRAEVCDCYEGGEDGTMDLTLKFPAPEIVAALGEVADGEQRMLTLTGMLSDGTAFEASDCMVIRANGKGPGRGGKLAPPDGGSVTLMASSGGRGGVRFTYSLPEVSPVTLTVYDVSGRVVRRLVSGVESAGTHTVEWNPSGVPSGIYFYRLNTPERTVTQKAVLMR